MTSTKMMDVTNFRRLMHEVQLNYMSPEGAAAIIDEHIAAEVARRTQLDLDTALHPLNIVQFCADRIAKDPAYAEDRTVVNLIREYATLRRRMADNRILAAAPPVRLSTVPSENWVMPKKDAERQMFDSLRELDMGKMPPPSSHT